MYVSPTFHKCSSNIAFAPYLYAVYEIIVLHEEMMLGLGLGLGLEPL